jgi:hypothetical protein
MGQIFSWLLRKRKQSPTPSDLRAGTLTLLEEEFNRLLEDDTVTTEQYISRASAHLRTLSVEPKTRRLIPQTDIDAHKLLSAMLEHAPTDRGKRYTACVIISCEEKIDRLLGLATDWLKFLLWPCAF